MVGRRSFSFWASAYLFSRAFAASFREGHLSFVIVNPGYVEKEYLDKGWRRARAGECTLAAVGGADVQNVGP